ncbi:MAG: fused MFS/spermidine synthase [Verrucomicrobiota bacterium]
MKPPLILYALVVFLCGAVTMCLEMVGSRILAPILGNSIYTWSALIGVVLIGLSIGGCLGGILIDKRARVRDLLLALVLGAIFIAMTPLLRALIESSGEVKGSAILVSGILFFVPCLFLGAISPMSVKLAANAVGGEKFGLCAGVVSMAGSLGSFIGVVIPPFLLIPNFGLNNIIVALALIHLGVGGMLYFVERSDQKRFAILLGVGLGCILLLTFVGRFATQGLSQEAALYEKATPYHLVQVFDEDDSTRSLRLDTTMEGSVNFESEQLPLKYQNQWRLVLDRDTPVRRALCIGAGAFGVPRELARQFPDAAIEVSEIDPEVVRVGYDFFQIGDFPNISAKAADGRQYLRDLDDSVKYDFVFLDAYNGIRYIPPHLATVEFFEELDDHLSEDALIVANVISAVDGEYSQLLWSFVRTLREVYPDVRIYPIYGKSGSYSQNVIMTATRSAVEFLPDSKRVATPAILEKFGHLLTDEHNRVEYLVAQQLKAF